MQAYERFHEQMTALHAPEVVELDLTLAQLKAVYLVAATGPIHMGALSVQLGTSASTTSELVERLVGLGLLERREAEGDRRQVVVGATPAALARIENLSELGRERMRELLARIASVDDLRAVGRAIEVLADAAGDMSEETGS